MKIVKMGSSKSEEGVSKRDAVRNTHRKVLNINFTCTSFLLLLLLHLFFFFFFFLFLFGDKKW